MTDPTTWRDRVLVALGDLPDGRADSELAVIEQVAILFADRFAPDDRVYEDQRPRWQGVVQDALAGLRTARLVRGKDNPALTASGARAADAARAAIISPGTTAEPGGAAGPAEPRAVGGREPLLMPGVIAAPLRTAAERAKMGFSPDEDDPMPVMAELNLRYRSGPDDAFDRLRRLWVAVTAASSDRTLAGGEPAVDRPGRQAPSRLAEEYATGLLSVNEMKRLVAADAVPVRWPERSLRRIWPDFPVQLHVDGSCVTVKADAARRAFNAYGDRIVWAVVDSGIWGEHPHFTSYGTLTHESVRDLHRLFPLEGDPTPEGALVDESGHGTHVAGIIAGAIEPWKSEDSSRQVWVTESRYNVERPREPLRVPRQVDDYALLAGMAPKAKLVSLKVLQAGGSPDDRVARVIRALSYVRQVNGESIEGMRIHGVNLSVGYEFDPQWFACGQSPLCKEVDKLVRSGVVVVVAAGNSGYGSLAVRFDAPSKFGLGMTINDPGNSERAVTVGATHRDAPHLYGVSYFSSKGPTGDGRRKPDLVAPGERITSCAAGANLAAVLTGPPDPNAAVYVEDTGTSMAAPHVSGAIAALLSVRREFIGRPEMVKQIIVDSATSLGRNPDFEGGGLLDLMRALQSI